MPTAAEHLTTLRDRLDAIDGAARALAAPLAAVQRLWRPAPDRWGVADCFEHLIATGAAYYPRASAALVADRPIEPARRAALAGAPYRSTWFGRWFVRAAGPGGRRIRAPRPFVPPPAQADAPERFLVQQGELRAILAAADGRDLGAVRVPSPVSRLLTLRLGDCLAMLVAHEARHLAQAERVRAEPGFPPAA